MYCPNCGSSIESNEKFCGSCGVGLNPEKKQEVTPPPYVEIPNETLHTNHGQNVQSTYQQPNVPPIPMQQSYGQPLQFQTPAQQTYSKPVKNRNLLKIIVVFLILFFLLAAGLVASFKLGILSDLKELNFLKKDEPIEISNVKFLSNPSDVGTEATVFQRITSITVLADLNNVKNNVDIEIIWLYDGEEIVNDLVNYKSGDWIEYAIETTDGLEFDLGHYSVVFYIDGVVVANGSFEVQ